MLAAVSAPIGRRPPPAVAGLAVILHGYLRATANPDLVSGLSADELLCVYCHDNERSLVRELDY